MEEWNQLREKVLEKLVPDPAERKRLETLTQRLTEGLQTHLKSEDYNVSVEVHGSVSRDTWLRGQRDIDVFLVLDPETGREGIKALLESLKRYLGSGWVEAYAEHPYLQADLEGFRVEFVPCFKIEMGEEPISATDRTPLHTEYVSSNLEGVQANEVRLLKQFMKGIDVYGAEIKVQGFSGYLCELLILGYDDFIGVLEAASDWNSGEILELEDGRDPDKLRKKFRSPLIVPDPVDQDRNVASAISSDTYWTFIAASRSFISEPSKRFFFPKQEKPERKELLKNIKEHPLDLLFLVISDDDDRVADVLWGQLHKTREAIINHLEKCGFKVVRGGFWSDESTLHVLVIELESADIPCAVKQYGPPVRMKESSKRFLDSHIGDEETVSGPGIEGERWWVIKRRILHNAEKVLDEALRDEKDIGVSEGITDAIQQGYQIFRDTEIEGYLNRELSLFLDDFLRGRPDWID